MTHSSAAEAFRLNFISGLSSRINIHWDRVTWGRCSVGETSGEMVSRWETPDSQRRSTRGCFGLWSCEVSRLEGSIGSLILVKANSSFVPGLRVEVIWPSGSHSGYHICYQGVKSSLNLTTMVFRSEYPDSDIRSWKSLR